MPMLTRTCDTGFGFLDLKFLLEWAAVIRRQTLTVTEAIFPKQLQNKARLAKGETASNETDVIAL